MKIDPNTLLKALGSGIKLPGLPGGASPAPGIEQVSFSDLLKQAREGTLVSRAPVTIDPDSGIGLSEDQLASLTLAADRAEAAGVRTALVMLGDQRFILDVASRTVKAAASADPGILSGVDGVINLGSGSVSKSVQPAPAPFNSTIQSNPDIMKLLAELEARS